MLAVAASLARREGLDLPIPLSVRFPWAPGAQESEWQELVVGHLGLSRWEQITTANPGELDVVGPVARRCLQSHGLLYPHNAHFFALLCERAGGGSMLTGIDGDGLFGGWPWWQVEALLHGRAAPSPRQLARTAYALAPRRLRIAIDRRRHGGDTPASWLRPATAKAAAAALLAESQTPLRWSTHVEQLARKRYHALGAASHATIGAAAGVSIVHPFLDRGFLASLAHNGGATGWGDRSAALQALFGELLPTSLLTRTSKAGGGQIYWSEPRREFAQSWDGSGVNSELVDPDELRAVWLSERPSPLTGLLIQSAWLNANGGAAH